jgi:hypothetical protein
MSSSTKTTSQQQGTQTNTTDPRLMGLLTANYDTAKTNAASVGQPFQGQLTAGFNPTQTQAQGILSNVGTDPTYGQTNQTALNNVQGILGSNPNTTVTASPVNASTIAGTDLSPYMNPYTSNVIDASIAQNERARQIAGVSDAQKAQAAGAFGGSRSGVLSALTNEAYDRNDQQNIAGLNQANFTQAQNAAGTDAATRNQVGEFNSGQDVNAKQSSISNALAQAGFKVNAAGQLVADNNAALNTEATQAGILGSVGDMQQQQQQSELSAAYQNWLTGKSLTQAEQQMLNSALGLLPNEQTVSTSGSGSSTTTTPFNFGSLLGGLGELGMGLGKSGLGLSDGRLKADVVTLAHDRRGRRWVGFRYQWEPAGTLHRGVMAQEIIASDPGAVVQGADGFYRVDYSKLMEAA